MLFFEFLTIFSHRNDRHRQPQRRSGFFRRYPIGLSRNPFSPLGPDR